jgi:hypothetical protein
MKSAPVLMSHADLLAVLDDIRARVAAGDSFEGSLEYAIPDEPTEGIHYAVRAGYRIGNSQGQGGFRLIAREVPTAPDQHPTDQQETNR